MGEVAAESWVNGWSAQDPAKIDYSCATRGEAVWRPGSQKPFEDRDLGLAAASHGKLSARYVRVAGGAEPARNDHSHDLNFRLFLVLNGSIAIGPDGGESVTLTRGGVGYQPPFLRHAEQPSPDYEALELTSPAAVDIVPGREQQAHAQVPAGGDAAFYREEEPGDWVSGAGPREFFQYRDLDMAERTEGRIHVHLIRGAGEPPEGGTGWHYHTMSQIFVVLHGWCEIGVEGHGLHTLRAGDAMCVPSGPGARHNVRAFSPDYYILEACIPAEYETIPTDPPTEFARMA